MSLWVGFAWGCVFLGTSSVLLVFGQYGWNSGLRGTAEICTLIGGILGFISNYHAEYLYARAAARAPDGRAAPEVRLYWAATGGLFFPLCMFGFAWTGQPHIHWAVPAVFLCLSYWGIYIMYSSVFNYLADAYETYSEFVLGQYCTSVSNAHQAPRHKLHKAFRATSSPASSRSLRQPCIRTWGTPSPRQ